MKKIGMLLLALTLVLSLGASKKDKTDTKETINIRELYDDLVVYQERLVLLTHIEEEDLNNNYSISRLSDIEYETITREDLLERYYSNERNTVEETYMEQLLTAKDFITTIKDNIANDLDQEIGVEFSPIDGDPNVTYKFLYGEEGYIVISVMYGIEHHYVKIGMNEDKLEYYEVHYSYLSKFDPLHDSEIMYSYFKFEEDNEAVHINSHDGDYHLGYTSINTKQNFDISLGDYVVEGDFEERARGYVLNTYDPDTNSRAYLQVVDDVIISEVYDVFSDYGSLYRYEDSNTSQASIRLTVNFIEAVGWDYIVVPAIYGIEPGELGGIYDSQNTKLYNERVRLIYTDTYAFAAIDQTILKADLSDEHFSLQNIGLNLAHPEMNIYAFRNLQIDNFEDLKSNFLIDGLNFFADDLALELYNYLDSDIVSSIEGTNDPSNSSETTGDIAEFEAYMNTFKQEFDNNKVLYTYETGSLEKTFSHDRTATTNFFIMENIILEDLYYHTNSSTGGYLLQDIGQVFVGFEKKGPVVDYEIVYDVATESNLVDFLELNTIIYDPLKGVISVTQVSEYVFDLELTHEALGLKTEVFLLNEDIREFQNSTVTATYTFNSSTKGYSYTIKITDLTCYDWGNGDVVYTSSGTVSFDSVTKYDILNTPGTYLLLPQVKENLLLETPFDYPIKYYVHSGNSYMIMYLEPGTFKVNNYPSRSSVLIKIEDLENNLISNTEVFTIDTAGYYVITIDSSVSQAINFTVSSYYIPTVYEIPLDDTIGILNQTISENDYYKIVIPSSTTSRLITFTLDSNAFVITPAGFFDMQIEPRMTGGNQDCLYFNEAAEKTCYFYLEENIDYSIDMIIYEIASIALNYEFIELPTEEVTLQIIDITNILEQHTVIVSEFNRTVRVNFTVITETTYDIDSKTTFFNSNSAKSTLYDSEGNELDVYIDNFTYTFTPGDYYIIYEISPTEDPVIFETIFE